jgi:hypothetical protein
MITEEKYQKLIADMKRVEASAAADASEFAMKFVVSGDVTDKQRALEFLKSANSWAQARNMVERAARTP